MLISIVYLLFYIILLEQSKILTHNILNKIKNRYKHLQNKETKLK